jgi:hypothetical protein
MARELNLPWTTEKVREDEWVLGANGLFPWLVLDCWGVVIGRFDYEEQAQAAVRGANRETYEEEREAITCVSESEFRHLNAAIELQKGARRLLSQIQQSDPSPEHAALVYLADAVGQLIQHAKGSRP